MTNPHCRPPAPFGKPTPEGWLLLNPEEAKWLSVVFARIDTAQADVAISEEAAIDPEIAAYAVERVRDQVGHVAAGAVQPEDMEVQARTQEDKDRHLTRHRGKLTIIRGGLPPRPAF